MFLRHYHHKIKYLTLKMLLRFWIFASLLSLAKAQPLKKVIVIGETGAGKSHLCNVLTGTEVFEVGHAVEHSCTSHTSSYSGYLFGEPSSGMHLTVTDTGGLGDTANRDEDFLDQIAARVRAQGGVHGIIYVHNTCRMRLDRQARESLHAMAATLTNNNGKEALGQRLAFVFTHCTEEVRRSRWEQGLASVCEQFGFCDAPILWYDDYEDRRSYTDMALSVLGIGSEVATGSWRLQMVNWISNLPTQPHMVPSETERERLTKEHQDKTKRREEEMRRLKEEKAQAVAVYKEFTAAPLSNETTQEVVIRNLLRTIKDLERKLEELQLQHSSGACFSGESLVEDMERGIIAMKELSIGSMVATSDGWATVTTFLHWHSDQPTAALRIAHELGYLTLTGKHMVFEQLADGTKRAIPAEAVEEGTTLLTIVNGKALPSRVVGVTRTTMTGYYAPLTSSGTIVVNNVVASCYSKDGYEFSHEFVNHLMSPIRPPFMSRLSYKPEQGKIHVYARFLKTLWESQS